MCTRAGFTTKAWRNLPHACREGVGRAIVEAVGYVHARVEEYLGADGMGDGQLCPIPSSRLMLEVRGLTGFDVALARLPRTLPLYFGVCSGGNAT